VHLAISRTAERNHLPEFFFKSAKSPDECWPLPTPSRTLKNLDRLLRSLIRSQWVKNRGRVARAIYCTHARMDAVKICSPVDWYGPISRRWNTWSWTDLRTKKVCVSACTPRGPANIGDYEWSSEILRCRRDEVSEALDTQGASINNCDLRIWPISCTEARDGKSPFRGNSRRPRPDSRRSNRHPSTALPQAAPQPTGHLLRLFHRLMRRPPKTRTAVVPFLYAH